jgi:alpha-tubulin suppressor-like RCC1 family protein
MTKEVAILFVGTALALAGMTRADTPASSRGTKILQLQTGRNHTCAVLANHQIKCWGENVYGQLGLGDTNARGDSANELGNGLPYVDLGAGRTVVTLWPARNHTCASLDDGSLKCWGRNESGRLGLGDEEFRGDNLGEMGDKLPAVELGSGRHAVQVALGLRHSCAVLDNGEVKCWGNNDSGQLGYEDTTYRGNATGTMGNQLPAVNLGTGLSAIGIAAGLTHSCALLSNQQVKCWGDGSLGQLGIGANGNRGDRPGTMGDTLPTVELGTGRKALQIVSGGSHMCALLDDATVKCWGDNSSGALGLGDTRARGTGANEMGDQLPALALEPGLPAMGLAGGESHACAVLLAGFIKCWGGNGSGQLGIGDSETRGDKPDEMGQNLPAVDLGRLRQVVAVSGGGSHSCALFADGTGKCWGENSSGQLGQGDAKARGSSGADMGDSLAELGI